MFVTVDVLQFSVLAPSPSLAPLPFSPSRDGGSTFWKTANDITTTPTSRSASSLFLSFRLRTDVYVYMHNMHVCIVMDTLDGSTQYGLRCPKFGLRRCPEFLPSTVPTVYTQNTQWVPPVNWAEGPIVHAREANTKAFAAGAAGSMSMAAGASASGLGAQGEHARDIYAKRKEYKDKEATKRRKKDNQADAAAAGGERVLGGGEEVRDAYLSFTSMGGGVFGAGAGGAQSSVGGQMGTEDAPVGAGGETGTEQNGEVRVVDGEVVDESGQRISPANLLMAFYTSATQQEAASKSAKSAKMRGRGRGEGKPRGEGGVPGTVGGRGRERPRGSEQGAHAGLEMGGIGRIGSGGCAPVACDVHNSAGVLAGAAPVVHADDATSAGNAQQAATGPSTDALAALSTADPFAPSSASAPGDVSGEDDLTQREGAPQAQAGVDGAPNNAEAHSAVAAAVSDCVYGHGSSEAAGGNEGVDNRGNSAHKSTNGPLDAVGCDRLGLSLLKGIEEAASGDSGEACAAFIVLEVSDGGGAAVDGAVQGNEDSDASGPKAGSVLSAPEAQGLGSLALSPALSLDVDDQSMAEAAQEFLRGSSHPLQDLFAGVRDGDWATDRDDSLMAASGLVNGLLPDIMSHDRDGERAQDFGRDASPTLRLHEGPDAAPYNPKDAMFFSPRVPAASAPAPRGRGKMVGKGVGGQLPSRGRGGASGVAACRIQGADTRRADMGNALKRKSEVQRAEDGAGAQDTRTASALVEAGASNSNGASSARAPRKASQIAQDALFACTLQHQRLNHRPGGAADKKPRYAAYRSSNAR
jgi:hypothetical protein